MADPANPSEEIRRLADDLGKIPAELRKALRPALKAAAEPIVADARTRASWSTRIPRAITLSVRLGQRDPGVTIRVRSTTAPHARPYEGITGAELFRHPVFGHRDRWVEQKTKPFLAPAADAGMDGVVGEAVAAIDRVAREQGFR